MCSPLEQAFANSFLSLHEVISLNNCPLEFKPEIHGRYSHDTFLLFQKASRNLSPIS